eukprot:11003207-Alexandrium_andersonii.AAC.1
MPNGGTGHVGGLGLRMRPGPSFCASYSTGNRFSVVSEDTCDCHDCCAEHLRPLTMEDDYGPNLMPLQEGPS